MDKLDIIYGGPLNQGTLIVFIHGILSNGEDAWKSKTGAYWPKLLADKIADANITIATFSYWTDFGSGDYGIDDAANALWENICHFDFRNVVFVGHSMGGIVARDLIVTRQRAMVNKKILLFLVSSPSQGAWIATLLRPLVHKQARQLEPGSLYLESLNRATKLLIKERQIIVDGVIESAFVDLLDYSTASEFIADPYRIPGHGHIKVAKPEGSGDLQAQKLLRFISENVRDLKSPNSRPSDRRTPLSRKTELASDLAAGTGDANEKSPRSLDSLSEEVESHSLDGPGVFDFLAVFPGMHQEIPKPGLAKFEVEINNVVLVTSKERFSIERGAAISIAIGNKNFSITCTAERPLLARISTKIAWEGKSLWLSLMNP